jgi:hypothetical protein
MLDTLPLIELLGDGGFRLSVFVPVLRPKIKKGTILRLVFNCHLCLPEFVACCSNVDDIILKRSSFFSMIFEMFCK